jgi:hypothetical protein
MRILILTCAVLLIASTAAADAFFYAPESVTADGDGSFSFYVALVAGEGCVGWTGYGYGGVENVTGGIYVDTFCMEMDPIEPGTPLNFEVRGRLTDPTQDGIVWAESAFCTGGGGWAETTIRAPSVPNDDESWSTLKARYR